MDFLKRKPKDLDGAEADGRDAVDETGSIIDNDKAQKRQRMLFFGLGGVAVVASTMYVLRTETVVEEATKPGHETEVSTDALMNRQRVDQEGPCGLHRLPELPSAQFNRECHRGGRR